MHEAAARSYQGTRIRHGQYSREMGRGDLADGVADEVVGVEAVVGQEPEQGGLEGEQGGLGVLGLVERAGSGFHMMSRRGWPRWGSRSSQAWSRVSAKAG